jgi:hypothetical protein
LSVQLPPSSEMSATSAITVIWPDALSAVLLRTRKPTWLFGFCDALVLGLGSVVWLWLGSGVDEAEGSSVGAEVAPQFG